MEADGRAANPIDRIEETIVALLLVLYAAALPLPPAGSSLRPWLFLLSAWLVFALEVGALFAARRTIATAAPSASALLRELPFLVGLLGVLLPAKRMLGVWQLAGQAERQEAFRGALGGTLAAVAVALAGLVLITGGESAAGVARPAFVARRRALALAALISAGCAALLPRFGGAVLTLWFLLPPYLAAERKRLRNLGIGADPVQRAGDSEPAPGDAPGLSGR